MLLLLLLLLPSPSLCVLVADGWLRIAFKLWARRAADTTMRAAVGSRARRLDVPVRKASAIG
jgi:hypothetical protein